MGTQQALIQVERPVADTLASVARIEGRRAGLAGYVSALNPHPAGTALFAEWFHGWQSGNAQRSATFERRIAINGPRCRYADQHCDCGGRGTCFDVG